MSLDNIQLDIVVTLQGSQNLKSATQALQGVARAADSVRGSSAAIQSINVRQIKSWQQMTDALGAVERNYDAVFRAGAHMSMMGQGLIDSAERLARTALGVVDAYEGYDMMLRRGAVALNVNEEWQGKLDQAIQQTARSLGLQKPEEVAEGYYIWGAAAGVVVDTQKELNEITEIVQATMIATAMAGGTLEGNLNGVYGVLSQFNLPASQATDIVQKLALMTERTAAQFPDLINSLSYIGPLAESLGITFEDVTSILGLLADAGQKGSRAGRGLAMAIEGMSAPSGPAKKVLDELMQATHGMNAEFSKVMFPEGQFIGMRGFVMEMAQAVDGLTDAERGRLYATAFTNNATRALIPVIEDQIRANKDASASGREFTSVLDDQKYALDGAGEFFENMKDKALGSITAIKGRLTSSFFPVLQLIATSVMDMALPVMEYIGNAAVAFGDFLKANPELVKTAIRIAGIATAALAGAGVLFSLGGAIMYLIGNLGVFFQGIGRILGPFGMLIALFVGFGVAIWNNVGGIQDALKNFGDAVADLWNAVTGDGHAFTKAWEDIWNLVRGAAEWVIGEIADLLNHLADALRWLSEQEAFVAVLRGAVEWFLKFRAVIGIVAGLGLSMWAAGRALSFFWGVLKLASGYTMIKTVVMGIATAFGTLSAVLAGGGIARGITAIGTAIKVAMGPIGWIILAVGALYLAWENNFLGIRDIVANVWNWLTNTAIPAIVSFFSNLVTTVGNAIAAVIQFFSDLPGNIGGFLTMVWEAITGWIGSVIEAIGGFIGTVTEAIGDFLADLGENWSYYLGFIVGFVIGWIARIIAEVAKFVITLGQNIGKFLMELPGKFADWLGQVGTFLAGWFSTTATNAWNFGSRLIGNIVDWISKLPGRAMEWFGQTWTDVSKWFGDLVVSAGTWANNVVVSIVEFFKKLPGRVVNGIGTLVTNLRVFFKELPGKIMDRLLEVGGAIIAGVWDGISGAFQWFWDKVTGFFKGIIDGVKSALGIRSPSKVFAEIGGYMIEGMAVGINRNDSAMSALKNYSNALMGVAAGTTLGFSAGMLDGNIPQAGVTVTSDATRLVRIEMDLTSSDGSYSDANLEQLKSALTGSDLVRALERMAEAE